MVVDLEGKLVEGAWKPSVKPYAHHVLPGEGGYCGGSPHPLHLCHGHVCFKPAYTPVIAELALGVGARCPAPFARVGTEELGRNALQAMGNYQAVLLQNHGVVTVGKDMGRALNLAAIVEDAARVYIIARSIGVPTLVPEEDIQELFELFKGYGQEKK